MAENMWRDFINGLDIDFPEKGKEAPDIEAIIDDTDELEGMMVKITFDTYLFMNHSQTKYFMASSNQRMTQIGKMGLKEALLKYGNKTKRK
jgi:hypothetical protein